MAAIRNSCVARGVAAASAGSFVYTVPAGYVLLLKSVFSRPQGSGASELVVFVGNSNFSVSVELFDTVTTANQAPSWQGWLALNESDQIYVQAGAVAFAYWISGALLPFAPGL